MFRAQDQSEFLMMARPTKRDDHEAQRVGIDARQRFDDRGQEGALAESSGVARQSDVEHEQRDADGHHAVAEHDQPFVLLFFRHEILRPVGVRPA
jgi:hypothetical protein